MLFNALKWVCIGVLAAMSGLGAAIHRVSEGEAHRIALTSYVLSHPMKGSSLVFEALASKAKVKVPDERVVTNNFASYSEDELYTPATVLSLWDERNGSDENPYLRQKSGSAKATRKAYSAAEGFGGKFEGEVSLAKKKAGEPVVSTEYSAEYNLQYINWYLSQH